MKNKIIIFTGPSGVGKATIEKQLFKMSELALQFSVSATTRNPRANEKNGRDYYFISMEDFNKKIIEDKFVEYSQHFSNKYGTIKSELDKILKSGKNPFLEIETNGARRLMEKFKKEQYVAIFVAPPSKESLINRIKSRGTETQKQIAERVSRLEEELSHLDYFKHVVTNDNLNCVTAEIKDILVKELN